MRSIVAGMLVLLFPLGPADDTPRGRYEALTKEYDSARGAAGNRVLPQVLAPRFFALAEDHRGEPVALDALTWIASKCIFGPESAKALEILARDHSRSQDLKAYCGECSRYGEPFLSYENLLRAVLNDNPHREVRAAACVALASYLKMAKEKTESYRVRTALHVGLPLRPESQENFEQIKKRGLDKVAMESEALFERAIEQYADVRLEDNFPPEVPKFAKEQLLELRTLCIGRTPPEIAGKDIWGRSILLSDHRGKVVVLDFGSHRSCGVCRQMYPGLRTLAGRFESKPFALLGISVDDDLAELKRLVEKGEVTWPIWCDGENLEGPIASRWVIRSMPTFYVLDRRGVIRNKGFLQVDEIWATVDMLLKEIGEASP